jgi:hypothetical protein
LKKFKNITDLIKVLPENQLLITEELRSIIKSLLPLATEKLAYNVPFYYLNKRICFVWPTAIPWSGVKEDGVLLGFCQGHKMMTNTMNFRGTENKVVRFVLYKKLEEIAINEISIWLEELVEIDNNLY